MAAARDTSASPGQAAGQAPAASARTTAGRTFETCVRCGRRGLSLLRPAFDWEPKSEIAEATYPAGSPCCWTHEPVPAARVPHWKVTADLAERLGAAEHGRFPGDAGRAALAGVAVPPPRRCPVCAVRGHTRESIYAADDGDFAATDWLQFARGAAMLGSCWDCGHTLELAALSQGGPHVSTVTEPAQGLLWEPLHWAVTVRMLSPKQRAGEVDTYWAGPVHGRGPRDIPNTWIGTGPGDPQIMRFPSPDAARAALDSVFAPGSRWPLPYPGRPVRIVAVPGQDRSG